VVCAGTDPVTRNQRYLKQTVAAPGLEVRLPPRDCHGPQLPPGVHLVCHSAPSVPSPNTVMLPAMVIGDGAPTRCPSTDVAADVLEPTAFCQTEPSAAV
jgi:hypothetical protein